MKIETEFRGKDRLGDWYYGDLIHQYNDGRLWILSLDQPRFTPQQVIPETVGQFTGLTDTKGIKIFSDDLRKDNDGVIFRIYETYGGFIIKANYWKDDTKDLTPMDELIYEPLSNPQVAQWIRESTEHAGNIFDNPELIK